MEWISLDDASKYITIISALIATASLIYMGKQLKLSAKISKGQFLLELEKMAYTHNEVHLNLRPGGKWSSGKITSDTPEEWAKIDDYMGFFEHCELLMQDKSLSEKNFKSIFEYRVRNILDNDDIVQAKLIDEKEHWEDFLKLQSRLNIKS